MILNLFLEGPRGKQQLIGPIDENRTAMHHCFTDYILAQLEKSLFMVDLDDELAAIISAEERERIWKQENPHPCRTTCPGSATQLDVGHEDHGQSDDDDADYHGPDNANGAATVFSTQTRPITRSSATALTPQLSNLDVGHQTPPLWLQDSPILTSTITSGHPPPLALTEVPNEPTETPGHANLNDWSQADHSQFFNFQNFEFTVNRTRIAAVLGNDESFSLSAGSVTAAARGLVNAIKGVKQDRHARLASYEATSTSNAELNPLADFYLIEPADVTLSTLFSSGDWIFKA
jgi:hypothetical protein